MAMARDAANAVNGGHDESPVNSKSVRASPCNLMHRTGEKYYESVGVEVRRESFQSNMGTTGVPSQQSSIIAWEYKLQKFGISVSKNQALEACLKVSNPSASLT